MALIFLKAWWKEILIALIIAAAALYVHNLNSTIADQTKTISDLKLENTIVKDNNAKLEAAISANNAAITKLADGAESTKSAFEKLNTNVKGQLNGLDGRLKTILASKKPVTCEETIQYLIDGAKEYQK